MTSQPNYMRVADVIAYFDNHNFNYVGFWDHIQVFENIAMLPTTFVKTRINEQEFREMQCQVTTYIFDI